MVQRTNTQHSGKHRTTKRYEASTLCYKDYLGNPVFNHKVEQVLRAVLSPLDILRDSSCYNVSAVGANLTCDLRVSDPSSYVFVGTADHKGFRFTPTTNSLLISLGYNPNVLLYTLCCAKDNTNAHTTRSTDSSELISTVQTLIVCAYDLVFNYKEAYRHYITYYNEHKDNPASVLAL